MPLLKHATFRQLATLPRRGAARQRLGARPTSCTSRSPRSRSRSACSKSRRGTPLLQRTGRGIRLTEAGELLAGYAGRILDLWREAGEEMATLQGVFTGTLRVGAVTTAEYLLPPMLVTFATRTRR